MGGLGGGERYSGGRESVQPQRSSLKLYADGQPVDTDCRGIRGVSRSTALRILRFRNSVLYPVACAPWASVDSSYRQHIGGKQTGGAC